MNGVSPSIIAALVKRVPFSISNRLPMVNRFQPEMSAE